MYYNYNTAYPWRRPCYGPSPVIPLIVILALLLVIFWDALCEWYEYGYVVKDSIGSNVKVIMFVTFVALMFLLGFVTDVVALIIPLAIFMVILPFLSDITIVLVLLVVVAFLGIHYYPPQKSISNGWGRLEPTYGSSILHSPERNGSNFGFGLTSSLLCYLIMLACLFICIAYYEDEGSRWICLALVLVIMLFFIFTGFGDDRSGYSVRKTGLFRWNWNWLGSSYQSRDVGSWDGKRGVDSGLSLSLGLLCYLSLVVCIFLCMVFCNNDFYWCLYLAVVLLVVLYFNYSEPEVRNRY